MQQASGDWPAILAECLENLLTHYLAGDTEELAFVSCLIDRDPVLYDIRNVRERDLRIAWNFGDYFGFHAEHHDPLMARITWAEAVDVARDIIASLRSGQPITNQIALQFTEC